MKIIIPSSFIAWHLYLLRTSVSASAILTEFQDLASYKGEVDVPVGMPQTLEQRVAKTLGGSGALTYRSYKGAGYPIAGSVAVANFEDSNFELLEDGMDYTQYIYGAKTVETGENYRITDI